MTVQPAHKRKNSNTSAANLPQWSSTDDHLLSTPATPPNRSRLSGRSFRPVAATELVNVISTIVQATDSDESDSTATCSQYTWTSPCGEVTIERRETPHDELRFFIQNPDDYYTEYTLNFRNYLVFVHRDLVWRNIRLPRHLEADSTEDIPESCWNILSEELRSRELARQKPHGRNSMDQRSISQRRALGALLRAG